MAKSKAELMRESRERRRKSGLMRVEVQIPKDKRESLARSVKRLGGIYEPK